MAVYKTTSIKPLIARVIRNTRIIDMTYADDIMEWIGEALDRCMIRSRLEKTYKVLTISNHSAKLPCGLVSLSGVIYNGRRLRKGTSSIDVRIQKVPISELKSYFVTDTEIQAEDINSQNINLLRGGNIVKVDSTELQDNFYDLSYNYIKTSFKEGQIIVCYKVAPIDSEGYPIAPDLEELREGVFWYVCSKLVFTGYKLPNSDMTYAYCDAQATKFFRKAKNIIKAESTDEKENQVQLRNNLIPPDNYYESFFTGGEQRKFVR
jgi:hypothetical protein